MKALRALVTVFIFLFFMGLIHAQGVDSDVSSIDEQELGEDFFTVPTFGQLLTENSETEQDEVELDNPEIEEEPEEPSIITIENAANTSYLKDEKTDTDIIRFSGDVRITVEKGTSKTIIYSNLIDFDRSRNILYAEGSVVMEQLSENATTERLTADSLLFNTITLEGVFNKGRVVQEEQEALSLSEGSTLIVFSDLFARDSSDAVTFKNGELTFCNDEDPHWKIKASYIWLLPGNEFAFANALLYVGPLPVMYFPFFYYPKDELVFNPAFGYRAREGFFVQTTTYFIGRKPLTSGEEDGEDEIGFNFLQQSQLKEQELQGLILRNLDANATAPSSYLKLMADYYTTLGGMIGIEGSFKPNDVVTSLSFNTRIGFSNVVFPVSGFPLFVSYNNDEKYTDYGWLFGTRLPFRYGGFFETDVRANDFLLSISLPFYSDPWFDSDFEDRQESMDWIDFFLSGTLTGTGEENDDDTDTGISGYTWNISGSYTPKISILSPWVTSLSLSSFSSSVVFAVQDAPDEDFANANVQNNSPNRKFFYPSQLKPLSLSANISGTLVQWPPQESTDSTKLISLNNSDENSTESLELLEKLFVPEDLITKAEKAANEDIEQNQQQEIEQASIVDETLLSPDTLPNIAISSPTIEQTATTSYNLTYSITPKFSTLYTYSGTQADDSTPILPSEFSLSKPRSSEIQVSSPINLTSTLSLNSSLVSLTNSFDFTPHYQEHPILSSEYHTEAERNQIIKNDFTARKLDLSNTNKLSIKPLLNTNMFANTSINWNTSVDLVQTEFSGTIDEPSWNYSGPEWDAEYVTEHNLNAVFEARQQDFSQSLTLQTNLAPLVDSYTGSLLLAFPIGSVSLSTGYKKQSLTSSEWLFQPLSQSSTWTFFDKKSDGTNNPHKLTLRQSFVYNIEDEFSDRLSTSLSWQGLQISYDMRHDHSYTLDTSAGWVRSVEQDFLPFSMSVALNISSYEYKNEKETVTIKPGISTALSWDMIIPTRSYFSFIPSLSLNIKDFLTITFRSESRNEELLRYLQGPMGFSPEIPGERNIFIDLWNSFAFLDEAKRTSSGFKIKSFVLEVEHDLHDWTLSSEFEIEPRIITDSAGNRTFDYKPYFTIAVAWKPMQGIKTTIEDEYGTFTLNP